jgi:hypothetical protein
MPVGLGALDSDPGAGQPWVVHFWKGQQMTRDEDHLRLLSIFHYVVGGLAALFAFFPAIYLVIGLFLVLAPDKFSGNGPPPPAFAGWILVIFACVFITLAWIFAAFLLIAGRFLARRKHYAFCLVVAAIECLFMPFGTVLGVFTIIALMREPVKQLFEPNPPGVPSA